MAIVDADESAARARAAKRRRRRRKAIVAGLVLVLFVAGAGTAWAMRASGGPAYRLAAVRRADVQQTVDSDGSLSARNSATLAFAAGGTVNSVQVAVGDKVQAGHVVATIDATDLQAAVTSAQSTLAQAKQQLADDKQAQATGTTVTSASLTGNAAATSGTSNWSTSASSGSEVVLVASVKSTASDSSIKQAQAAVVAAQHALDAAVKQQDGYVDTLVASCSADKAVAPVLSTVTATGSLVSGDAGSHPTVVTLRESNGDVAQTTSPNPQRLPTGGSYSFAGVTAGATYLVDITRAAVVNTDECAQAITGVKSGQTAVDTDLSNLDKALRALTAAVDKSAGARGNGTGTTSGAATGRTRGSASTNSRSGVNGQGSNRPATTGSSGNANTGSGSTGSGSGSAGAGAGGHQVTAEQIAADTKSIDAAQADVAVAEQNVGLATLRTPIAGTVGAVSLAKGKTVTGSSTASTVTVVGNGTLSINLNIGLADIDLVRVGQTAQVTVDGHSTTLPAKVSYVGVTNSATSTGSSSTYPVTVQLEHVYPSLYDGMGASVAIDVGRASRVLSVPISAVHTVGTRHFVYLAANGERTATPVTLGLVGNDLVQIKSGVTAGQQVILADIGAAIPSSNTFNRRGTGGALGGLTGGGGQFGGRGFGPVRR